MTKVAILIPVHNHIEYTKKCLQFLNKHLPSDEFIHYKIILIDDGSIDKTDEWVHNNFPEVHILYGDGNLWWSGSVNLGANYALNYLKVDYLLLWNNDIVAAKDYFEKLSCILKYNREMIIGSKIYIAGQKNLVWSMGGTFDPYNGRKFMIGYFKPDKIEYLKVTEVDWLTGMGTVIHRNVIDEIGYWDAKNFPQYHGDCDFTYGAKINGFKIKVYPELKIWNDIKNTGLKHGGNFIQLMKTLIDTRSNFNVKKNIIFYKKYAKSAWAYTEIIKSYCRLIGGFIKWKILGLLKIKPNHELI